MSDTPKHWTAAAVPDQTGRTAVITGANSGIGFEAATVLAARGATVVLACRDLDKAKEAADRVAESAPGAAVQVQRLDLAALTSVRAAARELRDRYDRIDLLVNNAGVTFTPRQTTEDGFELQFGTNHLGHFALTGLLLDRLLATPGSRVVTISSMIHRAGRIHFDDLQLERKYGRSRAYGQSKLANLMFTYELQRRLAAAGASTIAVAAHPGGSRTDWARHLPRVIRIANRLTEPLFMQTADKGAWPTLRAATDPTVQGGEYYGPDGITKTRGYPKKDKSSRRSHDAEAQSRLWAVSEELTRVGYPV
jgi:NAD(P)-dependent dehydrogenase (short-subunit alcohol dehydrogenase family)